MDKFYGLVFDDRHAFYKLCKTLPSIINDVLTDNPRLAISNTVYQELSEISTDMMSGIYLLAFSTYEGFESFMNEQ